MAVPVFVLNSAGHVVKGVASTAGKMVKHGLKGASNIGKKVARNANTAINKTIGTRRRRRN